MDEFNPFEKITIVLVRPKYSTNIGSCARAMKNMGFEQLIVVSPVDYNYKEALKLSTHAARDVLEKAVFHNSLDEALKDFTYCVGTTARLGRQRNITVENPWDMAKKISGLTKNNKIALLFGPEDKGLQNEDIKACQLLVNIPTQNFSSLNLSQAVMILTYELNKSLSITPEYYVPNLATKFQLDGMYEHLKKVLIEIDFINPENPDHWLDNFRKFFSRQNMRAKDVNILRGVLRQIDWYGNHMYEKSKKENSSK